jgi:HAAS domain-containing protein
MADEPQQKIENYLTKLRGHLRGVSEETTREILKELRSHIMEKAAADGMTTAAVDATLTALRLAGPPFAFSMVCCAGPA